MSGDCSKVVVLSSVSWFIVLLCDRFVVIWFGWLRFWIVMVGLLLRKVMFIVKFLVWFVLSCLGYLLECWLFWRRVWV